MVLLVLGKNGVIVRYGAFEYTLLVTGVVLIFAAIPGIVRVAVKEAVPAKKSDFVGYAVILAFILLVGAIGYVIVR